MNKFEHLLMIALGAILCGIFYQALNLFYHAEILDLIATLPAVLLSRGALAAIGFGIVLGFRSEWSSMLHLASGALLFLGLLMLHLHTAILQHGAF